MQPSGQGVPDWRQSLWRVELVQEALFPQEMHFVMHCPPQLCSVDVHPIMHPPPPLPPRHPLRQCWYADWHAMAHELA